MSIIDVIIVVAIVWAMYSGFKRGFIVQVTGIAGVIAGIWLGFLFGRVVGGWLDLTGDTARVIGFIIVVVLTLIVCAIVGRLVGGLIKLTGLGMLDTVGGMLLAALKMLLILSVLLVCFDIANHQWRVMGRSRLDRSKLYTPVMKISQSIFPVVDNVRTYLFEDNHLSK